jgi:hypothetical protein
VKKLRKVSLAKRLSAVVIAVAFTLALVSAAPVEAKKVPIGTMDLEFNLLWPGPNVWESPDWVGTITFDSVEYDMVFFAFGSGKPFVSSNPSESVHFFAEIWAIYEWISFDWETGIIDEHGDLLMWGYDYGVTNLVNSKYHMNGDVQFDELFGKYVGRSVHMSGIIEWYDFGAPHYAPGTFRIN